MMIVCSLLASSSSARAEPDDQACSNRTLSGDYGNFNSDGVLIGTPGPFLVVVRPEREFHTVLNASAIADTWIKVEESPR
jgi:hypothetical protein